MLLWILLIILSLIIIITTDNPIILVFGLLMLCISLIFSIYTYSPLLALIIFFVFIRGLIVFFAYFTTIQNKIKALFTPVYPIGILIATCINYKLEKYDIMRFNRGCNLFFGEPSIIFFIIVAFFLFIAFFIIVKLIASSTKPIRQYS